MKIADLLIAALLGALAIAIILVARQFPTMTGLSVGPGLFPIVLASALLLCAGLLAWQARLTPPAAEPASDEPELPPAHRDARFRFLSVVAACAIFAGLGSTLGFVIVGIVSVAQLMVAFGVSIGRALLVSCVTVVLLDLFFVKVMRIPLPLGVLAPLGGWL